MREKAAANRLVLVLPFPPGEEECAEGGGVGEVDFFDEGFRTNAKISFITLDFSFRSGDGCGGSAGSTGPSLSRSMRLISLTSSICIFWTKAIVSLGLEIVIGGIKGTVGLLVGVMLVIIPWENPMGLRRPAEAELSGVGSMVNWRSSMIGVMGERRSSCVGLFLSPHGSIP